MDAVSTPDLDDLADLDDPTDDVAEITPVEVEPDCDPYYDWDCDDYDLGYTDYDYGNDYESFDDALGLDDSVYKYHDKEDLDDMGGFMVAILIINCLLLGLGLGLYVPYLMLPEPR